MEKTLISQDSPAPLNVAGVNDSHAKLIADFPNLTAEEVEAFASFCKENGGQRKEKARKRNCRKRERKALEEVQHPRT